jgi:hypothetical protein
MASEGLQAPQRYELDVRAEREAALLRGGAALLVLFAGTWLFALPYSVPRVFAAIGFVFAALWLVRAARIGRRIQKPAEHYLELGRDALRLREGELLHELPYGEIASVSIDEDRLVLRIARRQGPTLEIEPRYRGVALHALCDAIRAARSRASGRGGCAPGQDG